MATATAKRMVYDVLPCKGGWEVKHERDGVLKQFERKAEATSFAREKAKAGKPSQLRIHGGNGRIQTEYTYGSDPRASKG